MTKNIAITILFGITAVACVATKTGTPTQTVITPSQTASPPAEVFLPIGDGGLISGEPCESPCFFGIHIDETPLNQVVSLLENNGISPCYFASDTTVFCGKNVISIAIGADSSTYIVDGLEYVPSFPITVAEIIGKYGNPSFVYVSFSDTPDLSALYVLVLWDSIKMRVDLPEIEDESYVVENITQIQRVIFLDETSYSNLTTDEYAQAWNGYGAYKP